MSIVYDNSNIRINEITDAYNRIHDHLPTTPVKTSAVINQLAGRNVFFKCENLQKTGSFKVRGALNSVIKNTSPDSGNNYSGVVAHSSGNHGNYKKLLFWQLFYFIGILLKQKVVFPCIFLF